MANRPPLDAEGDSEREQILSILATRIRAIDERLDDYEVGDVENEQMVIRWTRTLGYLSGQYRKLMKDTDLDEMEDTLDLVKVVTDLEEP